MRLRSCWQRWDGLSGCVPKPWSASRFCYTSHAQPGATVRPSPPHPKLLVFTEYNFTQLSGVVSIQIMEK